MEITTQVSVEFTHCLEALRDELLTIDGKFPREDWIKSFKQLHKDIMKKWIDPEERCVSCGGVGYHDYHTLDICANCKGTGRHRLNKREKKRIDE